MHSGNIAINGIGNTGLSFLLLWAKKLEQGNEVLPVTVLRDPFRSVEEVVSEINSQAFGIPALPFRMLDQQSLQIGQRTVHFISSNDPVNWSELCVSRVIEATGKFLTVEENSKLHIANGAKQVIVSAPLKDADGNQGKTLIFGFNESQCEKSDYIVDNGSCTTRATVHIIDAVLRAASGIEHISFEIIHPKTQNARWQLLRAIREGSVNAGDLTLCSRSTSAPRMIRKLFPDMECTISSSVLEVPCLDMSRCRLTFVLHKPVVREELRAALAEKENGGRIRLVATEADTVNTAYGEEDATVFLDQILFLRPDVVTIPLTFDNRCASAAAIYLLLEALGSA